MNGLQVGNTLNAPLQLMLQPSPRNRFWCRLMTSKTTWLKLAQPPYFSKREDCSTTRVSRDVSITQRAQKLVLLGKSQILIFQKGDGEGIIRQKTWKHSKSYCWSSTRCLLCSCSVRCLPFFCTTGLVGSLTQYLFSQSLGGCSRQQRQPGTTPYSLDLGFTDFKATTQLFFQVDQLQRNPLQIISFPSPRASYTSSASICPYLLIMQAFSSCQLQTILCFILPNRGVLLMIGREVSRRSWRQT